MGVFKQVWEVYKESGCELTLHRTIAAQLGAGRVGVASDADAAAVAAFVAEMEQFLRDPETFLLMLSVGLRGLFDTQSSFVGLLLREDALQASLIDFLLEKLSEFATEMEGLAAHAMEKNLPKLILRELRWIDHVFDSSELVEKLISALSAFPIALQRDMIYILPEIAGDEDAHKVIDAMLDLIRSEAELVVCCIEALGNFNVVNEQTDDVVKCVLERLDSSPLVDLPVIVKYLVQEAPGADVDLITGELREKLSATLTFSETATEAAANSGRRSSVGSGGVDPTWNEEALVLGAIVQGFYFREDLLKAFLASASKGGNNGKLCMIDIWVLIGAHSIPRDCQKVERIFKRNVSSGAISRALLIASIKAHANALKTYFGSALQLATLLITQQSNAACTQMGGLMFELLFEEFSQCRKDGKSEAAYYQGEIITSLMGFCLSATNGTTDTAFKTLLALVSPQVTFANEIRDRRYEQSHFKRRYRFNPFVPVLKQLLDAMEIISTDQVRDAYAILFAVAGVEDAELLNTIRKQMSYQETVFRVCGIIGAVAQMSQQLLQYREDAATKPNDVLSRDETNVARVFDKFVTGLLRSTISQGGGVDFLLREIKRFIEDVELDRFSKLIVENVSAYSMDMLTNRYMDNYDPSSGDCRKTVLSGALKSDLWLRTSNRGNAVYIKILDLAASPNVRDQESLHYLSPLVELVLACARKTGNPESADSVLVCPIQMMERSVIEDIAGLDDVVQNAVCATVWHSINWIRAIINFYADDTRPAHRRRVTERLRSLLQLESILLDDLLDSCPQFGPPGRQFSESMRGPVGKSLENNKKKAARPAKKGLEVDRRALIQSSFDPLRADMLKILAFPQLWTLVTGPSNTNEGIRPHALVETLVSRFEAFAAIEQQETKKGGSDLVLSRVFSPRVGWYGVDGAQSAKAQEVLESMCNYAHHFVNQLQSNPSQDDEAEVDVDMCRSSRNFIRAYLQIGSILFEVTKAFDRSSAGASIVKLCQQYFLPRDHHVQMEWDTDDLMACQVIESCFMTVQKFSSAIGDDLQMATTLLRCLLSIAGVAHGFPADQVAIRATKVYLKQPKKPTAATDMSAKISALAMTFLQQDWSGGDKKFVYKTSDLDMIITCYLNQGTIILDNIQELAIEGILALMEGANPSTYPTLTKKTITVFHRAMFEALVTATVRLQFANSLSDESAELLLNYFTQAVLLFRLLVAITKSFQKSTIVSSVLKSGRKFVEIVVRAMPFFKNQFLYHTEQIMKIIAEVQIATRRMQVLCAHGKLIKDGSASTQVPMVKRLLERFIYRGEELAREHGILDAFSTGVLKNKRIDGTTISKEELDAMEAAGSDSDTDRRSEEEKKSESSDEEDTDDEQVEEEEADAPRKKRK